LFLPTILRRLAVPPSLVTAAHRQLGWSPGACISFSTSLRSATGVASPACSSGTLDTSTVQKVGSGVAAQPVEEAGVGMLTGGARRATSAYAGRRPSWRVAGA
ncbi:hypothetical protein B0T21DRAFT_1458, partial [Apiosordaria backusii]